MSAEEFYLENQLKMAESEPDVTFDENIKMPSNEELLKMLDQMELTDEDKESLRDSLMQQGNRAFQAAEQAGLSYQQILVFLAMVTLIVLVFAFFANKLYKSLTYKEKMKEEKRKAKEERKKDKKKQKQF